MKIKINSKFPISLIKLNYNCTESEKSGSGPGSCSGSSDISYTIEDIKKKNDFKVSDIDKAPDHYQYGKTYVIFKLREKYIKNANNWNPSKTYSNGLNQSNNIINNSLYKESIKQYMQSSAALNRFLRENPDITPDVDSEDNYLKIASQLESLIKQVPIENDIIVYKGIPLSAFERLPDIDEIFKTNSFESTSGSEDIAKSYSLFYSRDMLNGNPKYDKPILVEMHVKKGTPGLFIETFSNQNGDHIANPRELILNRDAKYKIIEINNSDEEYKKVIMEVLT